MIFTSTLSIDYGEGFLSPKERGRGTGVKEKQITADDSAKAYNHVNEFSSEDGLDAMLEKEDVGNVSVCAKLHGVPMMEFSEDRWSSFARAIIELRANVELKEIIVVAWFPQLMLPVPPVPLLDGTGLPDGMEPAILNQQPA
ncbi:hypothetical protein Tco_1427587 [Tanacetum coccineum]